MSIITEKKYIHVLRRCINYRLSLLTNQLLEIKQNPQEPDYIATLSLKFPNLLAAVLQYYFPKKNLSVTGVFCRQKPLASVAKDVPFNYLKEDIAPELGDLLIVYLEADPAAPSGKIINSLLLQAKKFEDHVVNKNLNSKDYQLLLYTKWPEFTYKRAGKKLNGHKRNVCPKAIHSGAEYLLIRRDYTNSRRKILLDCAVPSSTLHADKDFASVIVDMLRFREGRIINDYSERKYDGWSQVVWDLLSICKGAYSKRKNIGRGSFPRLTEDYCSSSNNKRPSIFYSMGSNNSMDSNNNADYSNDEYNGGLSAIIIENLGDIK